MWIMNEAQKKMVNLDNISALEIVSNVPGTEFWVYAYDESRDYLLAHFFDKKRALELIKYIENHLTAIELPRELQGTGR